MNICPFCGAQRPDDRALCPWHVREQDAGAWAANNRIMCDFLHRKRAAARLAKMERDDVVMEIDS